LDYKKIIETINKTISKNNMYNLIIVFLVGVLILVVSNFFKGSVSSSKPAVASANQGQQLSQTEISSYEQSKKNELSQMLSKMQGVGRVNVMITFESGEELVPALNVNDGTSTTNEKDNEGGERKTTQENKGSQVVITNNGSNTEPLILKKYYPKVTGVMIVAEGAEDKQVQFNITKAISVLFNIPNNKVNVYPMSK
jgi:stage III sporulation protein AG